MKLRYLYLPHYGPLVDLRLVFDQSDFSQGAYALNFVAGVNATGKSSLLRAVFEVFRALDGGDWPTFPVDLVYEITTKQQDYTVVIASTHAEGRDPGVFYISRRSDTGRCRRAAGSDTRSTAATWSKCCRNASLPTPVARVPRGLTFNAA
jgi:hypothetical protein